MPPILLFATVDIAGAILANHHSDKKHASTLDGNSISTICGLKTDNQGGSGPKGGKAIRPRTGVRTNQSGRIRILW
jgi:hypothetical protein